MMKIYTEDDYLFARELYRMCPTMHTPRPGGYYINILAIEIARFRRKHEKKAAGKQRRKSKVSYPEGFFRLDPTD